LAWEGLNDKIMPDKIIFFRGLAFHDFAPHYFAFSAFFQPSRHQKNIVLRPQSFSLLMY
jgi:hypothetical protein